MKSLILIFSFLHTLYANNSSLNNRLVAAIRAGDVVKAELALTDGADVKAQIPTQNGWVTPIYEAIVTSHSDVINMLMEYEVNLYNITSHGHSALHIAVLAGRVKLTETLILDKGIEVDIRDRNGNTPLHSLALRKSVSENQLEAARILLKFRADVETKNSFTLETKSKHNPQIFGLSTPLHLAAASSSDFLDFLINEAKSNIHARDSYDLTPLHYTIFNVNPDVAIENAKKLIKAGAKLSARGTIFYVLDTDFRGGTIFKLHKEATPRQMASIYHRRGLAKALRLYRLRLSFCY